MRTRVKICGITSARDAEAAVRAGADALGVVLATSTRQVSIDDAEEILAAVPLRVGRIGVFVNAARNEVLEAVARLGLSGAQFSGEESPEDCCCLPVPVIKAAHVGGEFSWECTEPYWRVVASLLLDTGVPGVRGGTGRSFDWASIPPIPEALPVFVAGGLDPSNVGDAISTLSPFGVDVCSGVEERPGVKDPDKMEAFVLAVRTADERVRR